MRPQDRSQDSIFRYEGYITPWCKLETAKRRLIYTLIGLGIFDIQQAQLQLSRLVFRFLADTKIDGKKKKVITGHEDGVITINIAEADDVEREKHKQKLNEPYRTLLGHFRHEIGHYYWDKLIKERKNTEELELFRTYFGDERIDYSLALKKHYEGGPPHDWQNNCIFCIIFL